MTVNNDANRITFQGNGSTTTFTFPFATPDAESIKVITVSSTGTTIIQPSGAYSIVLNPLVGANPTPTGGTVTYPLSGPPLPVGSQLLILRDLEIIQPVSLANQGTLYPVVIEEELDYLTMLITQAEATASRAFTANIVDPVPRPTVPVAQRASQYAAFDVNGDLIPGLTPVGTVFISPAMVPVVGAATLDIARELLGIRSTKTISGAYAITPADNGIFFNMIGSAFYTVSLGATAGFPLDFVFFLNNNDDRGKLVSIFGYPSFVLWPSQSVIVSQNGAGTGWIFTRTGRWRSAVVVTFNVDFANGNDSGDGLGTGSQAFKTIQYAVDILETVCDGPFAIKLMDGTHQVGAGVTCNRPLIGSGGYSITGNTTTPANVKVVGTTGHCIHVTNNAVLAITGAEFSSSNGGAIFVENGAIVSVSNVRFGSCPNGAHLRSESNATLNVTGPIKVPAGTQAVQHAVCLKNSFLGYNPGTVTFEGSVSFGYYFYSTFMSTIYVNIGGATYVGGANVFTANYTIYTELNSAVITFNQGAPGTAGNFSATGSWIT